MLRRGTSWTIRGGGGGSATGGMILERHIMAGLIVSDVYIKRVKPIWKPELLAPEMALMAGWAFEHFDKYGRAPKKSIETVFWAHAAELPKAQAQVIEDVLSKVSEDYGREYEDGGDLDGDHLFDETFRFFRNLEVAQFADHVGGLAQRGRLDEAEAAIRDYKPLVAGADDSLASVAPRAVSWAWLHRIPIGKLTLLAGDTDLGKSTLLLDIAARISTGGDWPDGTRAPKGAVLIASTEDDYEDTVVPRLVAAGAELSLCHRIGEDAADIPALAREIDRKVTALSDLNQKVRTVLVDPLSSFLGKVDGHNEGAVRVAVRPLQRLAIRHRLAVVTQHHTRKSGSGGSAKDQVSGSKAFIAVSRSAFLVTQDQKDEGKRLMLFLKGNLTPAEKKTGLAYRIVGADVRVLTRLGVETTSVAKIEWLDEEVRVTADEALAVPRGPRPKKLDEVEDWLMEILEDGPMAASAVRQAAEEAGHSYATVRRAAANLGIKPTKDGFDVGWVWSMPGGC